MKTTRSTLKLTWLRLVLAALSLRADLLENSLLNPPDSANLLSQMASAIGKQSEAAEYGDLFNPYE